MLWSKTASREIAWLFEDTVFNQDEGNIWVFAAATSDVYRIDFTVSGTAFSQTLFEDEFQCPFDVQGSDIANDAPAPIDLRELGSGTFVVEAELYYFNGARETLEFTAYVTD